MKYKITVEVAEDANENEKALAGTRECDTFLLLTFKQGAPDNRTYGGVSVRELGTVIEQEDMMIRAARYADGLSIAHAIAENIVISNAKNDKAGGEPQ